MGSLTPDHPDNLVRASVQLSRRNKLRLIDTGIIEVVQRTEYNCLHYFLQDKAVNNPWWCFENVTIPEFYRPILEDMKQGNILVICDGSFQPSVKRGCATWILEGTSCHQQITGKVVTPGSFEDLSAYRSEISGILAALLWVYTHTLDK